MTPQAVPVHCEQSPLTHAPAKRKRRSGEPAFSARVTNSMSMVSGVGKNATRPSSCTTPNKRAPGAARELGQVNRSLALRLRPPAVNRRTRLGTLPTEQPRFDL